MDHQHALALDARLRSMPPVRALAVQLHDYDGTALRLHAPLASNLNDKGNAFGGSLATVATLSAWGLASLKLREAGHPDVDVYVQDSSLRYLAPLYDDLIACATLAPEQDWRDFTGTFAQRGKARIRLQAELRSADGTIACQFEGRFVALAAR